MEPWERNEKLPQIEEGFSDPKGAKRLTRLTFPTILFGDEVECKLAVFFITARKIKKNNTNT